MHGLSLTPVSSVSRHSAAPLIHRNRAALRASQFPPFVYKKLMSPSCRPGLADLAASHPSLARGLEQLLAHEESAAGEVEEVFCLSFEATEEVYGAQRSVELVPGGASIKVGAANRAAYVQAYVDWKLGTSIERQFSAFHRGFERVCGGSALELFRAPELELLVCGSPVLDFEALKGAARYADGFEEDSDVIMCVRAQDDSLRLPLPLLRDTSLCCVLVCRA